MSGARTVCFGAGTFYLDATLELTSADSDLTLQGDASGGTWFSGAAPIAPGLAWTQYKVAPAVPPSLQLLNQTDNQAGCTPNDPTPIAAGGCGCYNQTTTLEACVAKCTALGPKGCPNFAWSGSHGTSDTQSGWDNQCCIHADGVWHPSAQRPGDIPHVSGQWGGGNPAKNIWKTSLPAGTKLPDTPHLRVDGARSTRARHPNANPELDIWPTGWVPDAQTWLPAKPPKSSPQIIQVGRNLVVFCLRASAFGDWLGTPLPRRSRVNGDKSRGLCPVLIGLTEDICSVAGGEQAAADPERRGDAD